MKADPHTQYSDYPIGADMDTTAEKGLSERPSFSIRSRLTLGFLLFFFLSGAAILMAWYSVYRLGQRMHFLELADRYTFEIQQARRFEKNYFLYGTNLSDVLNHIETGQGLLISAKGELSLVIGKDNLKKMEQHLQDYKDLLTQMIERGRSRSPGVIPKNRQIEAELRKYGAEMVSVALYFADKERNAVEVTLNLFRRLPIVFLGILLILAIYMANFLTRQMLGPLTRLMNTTQHIAEGDFTPHMPTRRYKDEFSNLAIAINRMGKELLHRQEILVESQKLKSLGTLTAGVAHELNNPIGNISTSTQILLEEIGDTLPEYLMDLLTSIETEVEKARDIVKALLEFSGERDFELGPMDMRSVVDDTLKFVRGDIPHTITLSEKIPDGIVLDIDKRRMEQALLNLILNGIQAMETNGGELTIQGEKHTEKGTAVIEVIDTGVGIAPEIISQIFDPFFTTKDVGRGTGLGLSVTYRIIESHKGKISVKSKPGKGTKFIIELPLSKT